MIRKAEARDVSAVARIYAAVHAAQQQGKLFTGWIPGVYPVEETAKLALERDDLYVLEQDGNVLAAAIINRIQVDVYANGTWAYPAGEDQVLVLHTLVVDPASAGQGLGTEFVRYYEELARELGCPVLRMDTNARNAAARRLYARLGYREAGIVPCVFNGIPDVQLVLLEKRV